MIFALFSPLFVVCATIHYLSMSKEGHDVILVVIVDERKGQPILF